MNNLTSELITDRLKSTESNSTAIRVKDVSILQDLLPLLIDFPYLDLAHLLINWSYEYPSATNLLLLAVAHSKNEAIYNLVADALLSSIATWNQDRDCSVGAGEVFSIAFKKFSGFARDFVADRPEVRKAWGLKEGIDYHSLGKLSEDEIWNSETPLPDISSNSSIKCLLRQQGIPCGPLNNEWNDKAKRALAYFQLEHGLELTGEPDNDTILELKAAREEAQSENGFGSSSNQ